MGLGMIREMTHQYRRPGGDGLCYVVKEQKRLTQITKTKLFNIYDGTNNWSLHKPALTDPYTNQL